MRQGWRAPSALVRIRRNPVRTGDEWGAGLRPLQPEAPIQATTETLTERQIASKHAVSAGLAAGSVGREVIHSDADTVALSSPAKPLLKSP